MIREKIEKALEQELGGINAEGALCALNINGEINTYSAGNITTQEHKSSFYIYSLSKTITAVAIMLLAEKGLLNLNEDLSLSVNEYTLPKEVTLIHLLNHTGGISDYFSLSEYQKAVHENPKTPWSYEKLMKLGLSKTPVYSVGEGWLYSNPAYAILKEVIEKVSGQKYYAFIQKYIIGPLNLTKTKPFDRLDHGVELLHGVDPDMSEDFRYTYDPGWISTGSFISTVSDVSKFYQALFLGRLVSNSSLNLMKETISVPFNFFLPRRPMYGLGLMSFDNDPHGENYGHGGGGPGYSNYAKHLPDFNGKQVTVVSVVNASLPQTPFQISHCVLDCLSSENE